MTMQLAIVCVDDEWTILRSLGEQLKRSFGKDYDIELANGGEDALMLCAQLTAEGKGIPVIISDQNMPGMSGDVLLIRLHELYPKTLKIMLTGQADADSVGNVVNLASLYRYIRKPWDETDLTLTVTEALRRFQHEKQLIEQNELLTTTNVKLESSLALLLATLEATADGILALDNTGNVVIFNQKLIHIWDIAESSSICHEDDLIVAILDRLIEPDARELRELFAQKSVQKNDLLKLRSGHVLEYYLQPYQFANEVVGRVWSFRDVTQEKQTEALMKHQALHDALTNLPNRTFFNQELAAVLSNSSPASKHVAVMFLDLDRFKEVNDTLGHAVGDLLLQSVVHRLVGCLRAIDVIARWGGDEFVLFLPQMSCRDDVGAIAQRLIDVLQPIFVLEGTCLKITASIGIAVCPEDGLDSSILLQNADVALYEAKKCGRNNYQYYSSDCRVGLAISNEL